MSWGDLSKDELLSRFLQMEKRIEELEEKLDQKNERIEELETRLRKYENPHTPPSKRRSGTDESPTSQDDEDDDLRTDGGIPGRKDGHDPEWRSPPDPNEKVDVTCDCCPECGQHFDESGADAPTRRGDTGPTATRSHPVQPPLTSATPVERRQLLHTPTTLMRSSSG